MGDKCLVEVVHSCDELNKGNKSRWFILDREFLPKSRVFVFPLNPDEEIAKQMPLPPTKCKPHYYFQFCDEEITCNWQSILQVLPYTEEDARILEASLLEVPISQEFLHYRWGRPED